MPSHFDTFARSQNRSRFIIRKPNSKKSMYPQSSGKRRVEVGRKKDKIQPTHARYDDNRKND